MVQGERFSAISHIIGASLALAGLSVLVVVAARQGDPWKIVSFSIYGGAFYTAGVGFFAFDTKIRYFHGIWHLFVLAGSMCHFFTILYFVA